jgi:hypothetical protein
VKTLFFLVVFFVSTLGLADIKFSYERIFAKAIKDPGWNEMTLRSKLLLVRKVALKQKTVSDPVSDRYTLTAYGGSIDLVHFLMLAAEASKEKIDMKERLYKEWVQEGGTVHQNGFNPSYPSEAHPDDLPSNALGALYGKEVKLKFKNGETDLLKTFKSFIKPLKPLPDLLSKKFSHRRSVMGLTENATQKQETLSYIWFTAESLNLTALYNQHYTKMTSQSFCKVLNSGVSCLKQAGFVVRSYRGQKILIERR